MPDHRSWTTGTLLGAVLTVCLTVPGYSQSQNSAREPVTAKITLGPHEGAAHPAKHGHAKTGGGNIEISQPTPDTLIVTMSGNVAAMGCVFGAANGSFDFLEDLRFNIEFSKPACTGRLFMQAKVNGLLVTHGKYASAGMTSATATVYSAAHEIATLALPNRMIGGCDSIAVNLSQGPGCLPIRAGCYGLRQQFQVVAAQAQGCLTCGRATAEFSPSPFSGSWQGTSYPFSDVDRSGLGYTVTLRVVPDTVVATSPGPTLSQALPAPSSPTAITASLPQRRTQLLPAPNPNAQAPAYGRSPSVRADPGFPARQRQTHTLPALA